MNRFRAKATELAITAPPFLWLILFFLIPTLIVYGYSFRPSEIYGGIGEGWTLETVKSLFSRSNLVLIVRSFILSGVATVISLILALPTGYAISNLTGRIRSLILLLVILPFLSSFIVRIYAWKVLLHPEGAFKQFLVYFHIVSEDAILLYQPWTVILVMVYSYLPFAVLPIYAASEKFDNHFFEAAMDLGMTRLQAFFKVFVPSIKTGLLTATLLVFIPTLGAYVIPDIVGGPQTEMIGN
ncbi:MAG: Spermidine/putrescine transport system permease protein PotB, partial [Chlamydiae bacterium]|nr:Spermidine/putrescine transport system permease protein PotB [Chlamydiota bacterium]